MSTDFEAYRSTRYFPALDGLRAVSVLLVLTVHLHDRVWSWLAGFHGVTLFFVLSGFLITTFGLREEDRRGSVSLPAFLVRRTFRLFPVYFLVLGIYCLLIFKTGLGVEKRSNLIAVLPYYLTYMQEIPFVFGVNGSFDNIPLYQSWSLGIEWKFYLVWPVLLFVVWRGRPRARVLGTIALTLGFAATPALGKPGQLLFPYYAILVGAGLGLALHHRPSFERLAFLGRTGTRLALVGALVLVHTSGPHGLVVSLVYPLVAAALIGSLCLLRDVNASLFAKPWLVAGGRWSYAVYLVHILCINAAERIFPPGTGAWHVSLGAFGLATILSFALASSVHYLFELPIIRIGRRWAGELEAPKRAEA